MKLIVLQRVWTLTKLDFERMFLSRTAIWFLYVPFALVLIADLGIGWNGQNLTFFTMLVEACCSSREKSILGVLHEHFSWLWLFIMFSHLLPQLLLNVQDSFLVSQSLWIRLTPCSPYEVAISRSLKVVIYGIWIGSLSVAWGFLNSFLHQVSFYSLLIDALGIASYSLMCGGIVTVLDFGLSLGYSERRLVSNVAVFIPILLLIIFTLIKDSSFGSHFPYSSPFVTSSNAFMQLFGGVQHHFIMAALVGLLLLGVHVISKKRYLQLGVESELE